MFEGKTNGTAVFESLFYKVNGKLVPLSHSLKSGDQIEVISSNKQTPKENWLDFVVTAKARNKIKNSLKQEKKKIAKDGKETLIRKLKHLKITFNESTINELQIYFDLKFFLQCEWSFLNKIFKVLEQKLFRTASWRRRRRKSTLRCGR